MRVNGRASISIDPELMQSFAVNGKLPRCVLIVHIESVYLPLLEGDRALEAVGRGDQDRPQEPAVDRHIVAELSKGKLGGEEYDREAPERIKAMLY